MPAIDNDSRRKWACRDSGELVDCEEESSPMLCGSFVYDVGEAITGGEGIADGAEVMVDGIVL